MKPFQPWIKHINFKTTRTFYHLPCKLYINLHSQLISSNQQTTSILYQTTMAKSIAIPYAILFLVLVGTTVPTASSFELIPSILKCGKAIVEVEHCVVKLLPSFLSLHIRLTEDCCKAIVHIEESCLPMIFTVPLLGPKLSNITSAVCSTFVDPSAPPAIA